jgi:hypothetical protein
VPLIGLSFETFSIKKGYLLVYYFYLWLDLVYLFSILGKNPSLLVSKLSLLEGWIPNLAYYLFT